MDFVLILEKLGFSFWQLLIVFIVIYLRKEVKSIIERVDVLKFGKNEIKLEKLSVSNEVVTELEEVKSEIADNSLESKDFRNIIENRIQNKIIGALINIKKNTTYFWKRLKDRESGSVLVPIRESTLNRIKNDVELLVNKKYISFHEKNTLGAYRESTVMELNITILNDDIDQLINEADKF
ncbi:hypothetical protein [Aliikangiella coralliicola]|uniref:Uncharacterized protein n=1 Tax=Aliikangiella coralliicola TaxID=2592383 RepID=A0A545U8Y9_9GAMM|nr:hypothetical protein [Aliikangiella coralliicola]TQV85940.1 hypothetical protein FLL46_18655 [Aliikangiella coralliicola]